MLNLIAAAVLAAVPAVTVRASEGEPDRWAVCAYFTRPGASKMEARLDSLHFDKPFALQRAKTARDAGACYAILDDEFSQDVECPAQLHTTVEAFSLDHPACQKLLPVVP